MADLNQIQKKLLAPFPDEVISNIDGFDYVDPYYYFMRWHECFPQGFKFKAHVDDFGAITGTAMAGHGYLHVEIDDVCYEIEVPVIEPYQIGRDSAQVQKADQSANKFTSAACKNISRVAGIGLHLYQKAAKKDGTRKGGSSNGSSNGAAAASAPPVDASKWDGSEEVTFGTKWKGKQWSQVDDSYLQFLTKDSDPSKHRKEAVLEKARRAAGNVAAGVAQTESTAPRVDPEIPF